VVHVRFIALLKPPFKYSKDYRYLRWAKKPAETRKRKGVKGQTGVCTMARFEILDDNAAPLGDGAASSETLFELGLLFSVGRDMPVDLVSAHKWFNLAAVSGNIDAIRLRREIANQMSDAEIAVAQRAARDWLRANRAPVSAPAIAA
jgi:TPR repeat protein